MAKLKARNFNKTEAQTGKKGGGKPVPEGKYNAIITKTDYRKNRNKTGKFLEVEIKLLGKDARGKKVWDYLNLELPNSPEAEDIAWERYKALCLAAGFTRFPNDTKDIHGKKLVVELGIEAGGKKPKKVAKKTGQTHYPDKNVVDAYIPKGKGKGKKNKKPPWK